MGITTQVVDDLLRAGKGVRIGSLAKNSDQLRDRLNGYNNTTAQARLHQEFSLNINMLSWSDPVDLGKTKLRGSKSQQPLLLGD